MHFKSDDGCFSKLVLFAQCDSFHYMICHIGSVQPLLHVIDSCWTHKDRKVLNEQKQCQSVF